MNSYINSVYACFVVCLLSMPIMGYTRSEQTSEQELHALSHRCCICFECSKTGPLVALSCEHKACTKCIQRLVDGEDEKCVFCAKRQQEEDEVAVFQSTETSFLQLKKLIISTTIIIGGLVFLYAAYRRYRP